MQTTKNPRVVLVVEDEAIIRTLAAEALDEAQFETVEATSAEEAIRLLEKLSVVHLVFTDVALQGLLDGLDLAAYVKRRWPDVDVVVTSGRPLPPNRLPAGCSFIPKPYELDVVVRHAHSIVQVEY
jgi:CheY-like chemotaxis protein